MGVAIACAVVLGVWSFILTSLFVLNRNKWPIRTRNPGLSLAVLGSGLFVAFTGLAGFNQSISCLGYLITFWHGGIIYLSAFVVRHLTLYLRFGFNDRINTHIDGSEIA